jgi:GntR family transcriptional repressor for pyruvate dehydrogenase complex
VSEAPARELATAVEAALPRNRSVTDDAFHSIKQLIVSGQVAPGGRLPSERELSVRLGLSRSSQREAVRALSLLRVLDVRHGDGTYVSSLRPDLLVGVLQSAGDLLQDATLLEVFELRRVLEPAGTEAAATRISRTELAEVESCMQSMQGLSDPEEYVEVDMEFHDRLVRAGGNDTLAALVRSFSARTARVRTWRLATVGGVGDCTRLQHEAIFRAVAAGDAPLARATATVHVAEAEFWLRRLLGLDEDGVDTQRSDDSLTCHALSVPCSRRRTVIRVTTPAPSCARGRRIHGQCPRQTR